MVKCLFMGMYFMIPKVLPPPEMPYILPVRAKYTVSYVSIKSPQISVFEVDVQYAIPRDYVTTVDQPRLRHGKVTSPALLCWM